MPSRHSWNLCGGNFNQKEIAMAEAKFNIHDESRRFIERRNLIMESLATVNDHTIVKQIRLILRHNDRQEVFHLIIFLNAFCNKSKKRQKLLRFRIGRNTFLKLKREGFDDSCI